MGKASSRKKLRREAGYTARRLKDVRRMLELTEQMGGTMKLTAGKQGDVVHHVLLELGAAPKPLCAQLIVEMEPASPEDEVNCPECVEIPQRAMQEIAYKVRTANTVVAERNRRTLKALGG